MLDPFWQKVLQDSELVSFSNIWPTKGKCSTVNVNSTQNLSVRSFPDDRFNSQTSNMFTIKQKNSQLLTWLYWVISKKIQGYVHSSFAGPCYLCYYCVYLGSWMKMQINCGTLWKWNAFLFVVHFRVQTTWKLFPRVIFFRLKGSVQNIQAGRFPLW